MTESKRNKKPDLTDFENPCVGMAYQYKFESIHPIIPDSLKRLGGWIKRVLGTTKKRERVVIHMRDQEILHKAVKHYGQIAQRRKFIEEAAEAIHEMARCQSNDQITEELADLQIMLNQMKILFPRVNEIYELKLESLDKKIQTESKEKNNKN